MVHSMYRITCHHEWREVIDVNAIAIAVACNRCGEWEPIDDKVEEGPKLITSTGAGC